MIIPDAPEVRHGGGGVIATPVLSRPYAYDPSGNLTSRTERGATAAFTYDALGRRTFADYGTGPAQAEFCAGDGDCDGALDASDNCPAVANASQTNSDGSQINAEKLCPRLPTQRGVNVKQPRAQGVE